MSLPVIIVSQINPLHTTLPYFVKINLVMLLSHLRLGLPSCLCPSNFFFRPKSYMNMTTYRGICYTFLYHPHGECFLYRKLYFSFTLTTKHFRLDINMFYISYFLWRHVNRTSFEKRNVAVRVRFSAGKGGGVEPFTYPLETCDIHTSFELVRLRYNLSFL